MERLGLRGSCRRLGGAVRPRPSSVAARPVLSRRGRRPTQPPRLRPRPLCLSRSTAAAAAPRRTIHQGPAGAGRGPHRHTAGSPTRLVAALAFLAVAVEGWTRYRSGAGWGGSGAAALLSATEFRELRIAGREEVSPTAFVLAVRPLARTDEASAARQLDAAWAHGLWCVEVKQPQLQMARPYTPLPPAAAAAPPRPDDDDEEEEEQGRSAATPRVELRFLIRTLAGGEMSQYLSRLGPGDALWLRGPHRGPDVGRRLGDGGGGVVVVAGGTGLAPALQAAWRVLGDTGSADDPTDQKPEPEPEPEPEPPTVTILWANRRGVDAVGRRPRDEEQGTPWWKRWSRDGGGGGRDGASGMAEGAEPDPKLPGAGSSGSLARQIAELRRVHGDRFRIEYFVDEEGSTIGLTDIAGAMWRTSQTRRDAAPLADDEDAACRWHSAPFLTTMADGDDAAMRGAPCTCPRSSRDGTRRPAGRHLLLVSGPDGFMEAYCGRKIWHDGKERQGAVRGVVGALLQSPRRRRGSRRGGDFSSNDWLVLKL